MNTAETTKVETDRPRGPLNESFKFFLATLHPRLTVAELRSHFEAYGEVNYVKIIYDKRTGLSMGYGFLYLLDADSDRRVEEYAARSKFRISVASFSRIILRRHDRSRIRPLRFKSSHDKSVSKPHGPRRDGGRHDGEDYDWNAVQRGPPPNNLGNSGCCKRDELPPRDDHHNVSRPQPPRQYPPCVQRPVCNLLQREPQGGAVPYNGTADQQCFGDGKDWHQGRQNNYGYKVGALDQYRDFGCSQPTPSGVNNSSQLYPCEGESLHQGYGSQPLQQYPEQKQGGHWENGGWYNTGERSFSPQSQPASGPQVCQAERGCAHSNAEPSDDGCPPCKLQDLNTRSFPEVTTSKRASYHVLLSPADPTPSLADFCQQNEHMKLIEEMNDRNAITARAARNRLGTRVSKLSEQGEAAQYAIRDLNAFKASSVTLRSYMKKGHADATATLAQIQQMMNCLEHKATVMKKEMAKFKKGITYADTADEVHQQVHAAVDDGQSITTITYELLQVAAKMRRWPKYPGPQHFRALVRKSFEDMAKDEAYISLKFLSEIGCGKNPEFRANMRFCKKYCDLEFLQSFNRDSILHPEEESVQVYRGLLQMYFNEIPAEAKSGHKLFFLKEGSKGWKDVVPSGGVLRAGTAAVSLQPAVSSARNPSEDISRRAGIPNVVAIATIKDTPGKENSRNTTIDVLPRSASVVNRFCDDTQSAVLLDPAASATAPKNQPFGQENSADAISTVVPKPHGEISGGPADNCDLNPIRLPSTATKNPLPGQEELDNGTSAMTAISNGSVSRETTGSPHQPEASSAVNPFVGKTQQTEISPVAIPTARNIALGQYIFPSWASDRFDNDTQRPAKKPRGQEENGRVAVTPIVPQSNGDVSIATTRGRLRSTMAGPSLNRTHRYSGSKMTICDVRNVLGVLEPSSLHGKRKIELWDILSDLEEGGYGKNSEFAEMWAQKSLEWKREFGEKEDPEKPYIRKCGKKADLIECILEILDAKW